MKEKQFVHPSKRWLRLAPEMKFCHVCGGWCIMEHKPCKACLGTGVVSVMLPVVEETALGG